MDRLNKVIGMIRERVINNVEREKIDISLIEETQNKLNQKTEITHFNFNVFQTIKENY